MERNAAGELSGFEAQGQEQRGIFLSDREGPTLGPTVGLTRRT